MRLSDENLRGRAVVAADGQVIGDVSAMFIDAEQWKVESLRIKLRKNVAEQLGATHDIFHAAVIEVPVQVIQSVGDAIVLSVTAVGLRQVLPTT
jgi:sporulation protein YlmC with PRC-barrel domain